ncbi:MAG: DUF6090 family protein [Bacteroidota bacterium]
MRNKLDEKLMLLLRRLRQKLMEKNKVISYILYAIGEILLVVIGILIAVYFNNSNNQSKIESIEKLSLIRLAEDLRSDIGRYDFLIDRFEGRMDICDSTLHLISTQESIKDRLDIIRIHHINFFLAESNTTTYDEMLNTGRLYSLANDTLRSRIIGYYNEVKKWSTYISRDNQQLRATMIQSVYNDYWVIQEQIWGDEEINLDKYPWLKEKYSRELKDIEALIHGTRDTFSRNKRTIELLKQISEGLLRRLERTSKEIERNP